MQVDRHGDGPGCVFKAFVVEPTELQLWCYSYGALASVGGGDYLQVYIRFVK